jgi:hypothetical protein
MSLDFFVLIMMNVKLLRADGILANDRAKLEERTHLLSRMVNEHHTRVGAESVRQIV